MPQVPNIPDELNELTKKYPRYVFVCIKKPIISNLRQTRKTLMQLEDMWFWEEAEMINKWEQATKMSLIELIMEDIKTQVRNDNATFNVIEWILNKHLKQSDNKSIDDLIEKRIPVLENLSIQEQSITILKNQFRKDLETLKQKGSNSRMRNT